MNETELAEAIYQPGGEPQPQNYRQLADEAFGASEHDARYHKDEGRVTEYRQGKTELSGALSSMGVGEHHARSIIIAISGSLKKDAPLPNEERAAAVKNELRKAWGKDYEINYAAAWSASRELGRRSPWFKKHINASDLGNNATLIKSLAEYGRMKKG